MGVSLYMFENLTSQSCHSISLVMITQSQSIKQLAAAIKILIKLGVRVALD